MSNLNNYFNGKHLMSGTSIPTEGKFEVGDIIVNVGDTAADEPMWLCIVAGEPGEWEVIGKVEEIDLSSYVQAEDYVEGATGISLLNVDENVEYATIELTGYLENLQTENKQSLVDAINEVFQCGNKLKENLVDALVAKGFEVSTTMTFDEIIEEIKNN